MLEDGRGVFLEEHFVYGHVERRYDFLGIADQLSVQSDVEHLQMGAVNVHEWFFQHMNLKNFNREGFP